MEHTDATPPTVAEETPIQLPEREISLIDLHRLCHPLTRLKQLNDLELIAEHLLQEWRK
jgi:hypothetical protein